jgi:predicted transglutaminase-like cysteine proteinase
MLKDFAKPLKTALAALACGSSMFTLAACAETGMPSSTPMQLGSAAYAPRGYLKFCGRRPDQCGLPSPMAEADRVQLEKTLNEEQWANVFNPQPTATASHEKPTAAASDLTGAVDLDAELAGPSVQTVSPLAGMADRIAEIALGDPLQRAVDFTLIADTRLGTPPPITTEEPASTPSAPAPIDFGAERLSPLEQDALGASAPTVADIAKADTVAVTAPPAEPAAPPPFASITIAASSHTIHLTPEVWAALNGINQSINAKIRPMSDEQAFGISDYWTLPLSDGPRAVGNCKHYALEKRKALVDAGFSADALSIAIVKTSWGEVHAVLIVGTDQGDYVLDNLSPWIKGWREVNYAWVERQVPGKPLHWAGVVTNPNWGGVVTKPMIVASAY